MAGFGEGFLSNLGRGLSSAGAILSPAVDEQQAKERMQEQQMLPTVLQLIPRLQEMQREGMFRNELAALGPNATQEQMSALASRYGNAKDVLHYNLQSLDRKAQSEDRRAIADENRAARVQQAADMVAVRREALEQQNRQALERMSDQRERDAWTRDYRQQSLALQASMASINAEAKRLGLELQRDRLDASRKQGEDKDVQKLSAALEKANLPQADSVLAAVEKALGDSPELASWLTGPKGKIPDWMTPANVQEGRQALHKLFNITLKDRSGAAVTLQELERLKQEFGQGLFKEPAQIVNAVNQARDVINKHYASVASGFSPQTLGSYNENVRSNGGRVILDRGKPQPAAAPKPDKSVPGSPGTVLRFDANGNPI